jgi:Holliday junction resolvasome RuvABC endonuclease subunit
MSNQNMTESDVVNMERREMMNRLSRLSDAVEEVLDKHRYYQRAITEQTLEALNDEIKCIMRTFSQ